MSAEIPNLPDTVFSKRDFCPPPTPNGLGDELLTIIDRAREVHSEAAELRHRLSELNTPQAAQRAADADADAQGAALVAGEPDPGPVNSEQLERDRAEAAQQVAAHGAALMQLQGQFFERFDAYRLDGDSADLVELFKAADGYLKAVAGLERSRVKLDEAAGVARWMRDAVLDPPSERHNRMEYVRRDPNAKPPTTFAEVIGVAHAHLDDFFAELKIDRRPPEASA